MSNTQQLDIPLDPVMELKDLGTTYNRIVYTTGIANPKGPIKIHADRVDLICQESRFHLTPHDAVIMVSQGLTVTSNFTVSGDEIQLGKKQLSTKPQQSKTKVYGDMNIMRDLKVFGNIDVAGLITSSKSEIGSDSKSIFLAPEQFIYFNCTNESDIKHGCWRMGVEKEHNQIVFQQMDEGGKWVSLSHIGH